MRVMRRGDVRQLSWVRVVALVLLALTVTGCEMLPIETEIRSTATPRMLAQWAATASASSHYGYPDWSPNRATGAPDVDGCADDARAWSSARGNGVEWLELGYAQPVSATEVRIHQSYGRGAISRVTLIDANGDREVIWEGEDLTAPCPGLLRVRTLQTVNKVTTVRVDLDESRTGTWNQIDAVELVGVP